MYLSRKLCLLALGPLCISSSALAGRTAMIGALEVGYVPETEGEQLQYGVVLGDLDGSGRPEVFVGAPGYYAGGPNAGRAYILTDPGITGSEATPLSGASSILTGEPESRLGAAAAAGNLDGGPLEVAIAAPDWGEGRGRVYLFFNRSSGAGLGLESADLILEGDQVGQRLGGGGILFPGDVNGDGYADLLVSSPGRDDGLAGTDRGAVYLFLGNSFGWSTRTLVTADAMYTGDGGGDGLGAGMALLGDVNDDGKQDFLVSAPWCDTGGADAGQVYLFLGGGSYPMGSTLISLVASVRYRGDLEGDLLGLGLSGGGDVTGDGIADFLLGAPGSDINGADSGRVYVMQGRKLGWPLGTAVAQDVALFSLFGGAIDDRLGEGGLALAELNGDAYAELILAAKGADTLTPDAGALYYYLGRESGWGASMNVTTADVTLLGDAAGDLVGRLAPAGVADLDGNQRQEVLIGVPGSDLVGGDAGRLLVGNDLARWLDGDGDGYAPVEGDCDDQDADTNPGITTDERDEKDNDCDGQVDEDAAGGCSSSGGSRGSWLAGLALIGLGGLLRRRARD